MTMSTGADGAVLTADDRPHGQPDDPAGQSSRHRLIRPAFMWSAAAILIAIAISAVAIALPSRDERLAAAAAVVGPRIAELDVPNAKLDATGTFCFGSDDCFVMDAEPSVLLTAVAAALTLLGAEVPSERPLDMGLPTSIDAACDFASSDELMSGECAVQGEWNGAALAVRVRRFTAPDGGPRSAAQIDVANPSEEFVGTPAVGSTVGARDAVDMGVPQFMVSEFCSAGAACIPGGRPYIVADADAGEIRLRLARDLASRGFAVERASATGLGATKRLVDGRSVLFFVLVRDSGPNAMVYLGSPAGPQIGEPAKALAPPKPKAVALGELLG